MDLNKPKPPNTARKFLHWFLRPELAEEVEGDLEERFYATWEKRSPTKAKLDYWYQVLQYLRGFALRKNLFSIINPLFMFRHYLKISFRHLSNQRFYSLINIAGFAIGLACCLLILLYVRHELSYDRQYPEGDRIYRVLEEGNMSNGQLSAWAFVTTPLAETLLKDYPEVVQAARIAPNLDEAGSNLVRTEANQNNTYEEGFIYADPSFLEMFQFPMIHGDRNALARPYTIVLTKSKADRFFPGEDPIGKNLILNDNTDKPFEISGVMEDLPDNTHFQFDYLLSMEGVATAQVPNWGFSNFEAYLKLSPEADAESLETRMVEVIKKYKDPDYEEKVKAGKHHWFRLQPVKDIHLHSSDVSGYWVHGDSRYVWLFGAIAVFILIIAVINFMNLSTARSANRAKEVGLRKVLGSHRRQLAYQFLTESVMVSLCAFFLAVLLSWLLLPVFNQITGRELTIPWAEPWLIPLLLSSTVIIGLLSGLYPSAFLSSFQPIQSLKEQLTSGRKGAGFRSVLVVFQFTVSIVLIISILVVNQQMNYIQSRKLGFDKEQVLIIEDSYILGNQKRSFKEALNKLPEVKAVSLSSFIPVQGYSRNGTTAWPTGTNREETGVSLAKWYVDHDYIRTLDMEVVEGRDFSIDMPTDSQAIILNKKAVEMLGLDDPIGKQVTSITYLDAKTGKMLDATYTIIGVVENFHYESMKQSIEGLSLVISSFSSSTLLKTTTSNTQKLLSDVEDTWAAFAPNQPFRYHFLDERFARMYVFEQRIGLIITVFTGLAIFVACLGLFGLITFTAEQRSKEISIRKVLGASVSNITLMLTRKFTYLVLLALLIAIPVAWWLMRSWLQGFVYHTTMRWPVFVLSGGIALLIAFLTVSYQAIRAAIANPAETLRSGS